MIKSTYVLAAAAEPNFFKNLFEESCNLIESEADGFAGVVQALFDISVNVDGSAASTVFKAVGVALTTLFLCMEAFTYCANIDFNGGIEGAIKIGMKLVVCSLIISCSGDIVGVVTGLFQGAAEDTYSTAFSSIGDAFATAASGGGTFEGGMLNINYIFGSVMLFIIIFILFALFSLIVITMLGVVFETAILVAIAPVPLSTLCNSQARQTGISYIKNLAAVSMQWGVLSICFYVFSHVSTSINLNLISGGGNGLLVYIFRYASPLLCVIMLTVTITKASEITKRALGG